MEKPGSTAPGDAPGRDRFAPDAATAREALALALALGAVVAGVWLVLVRPAGAPGSTAFLAGPGAGGGLSGGWEAVSVVVEPGDEALARRMNDAISTAGRWAELRNSLPLEVGAIDGRVLGMAEVEGDDRDAAIHLTALRAVSAAEPRRRFVVLLEPERSVLLEGGRFGADEEAMTAFLARMASSPRPDLTGAFSRLELTCAGGPGAGDGSPAALEGEIAAALGRPGFPLPPARLTRGLAEVRVEAELDGRLRPVVELLERLSGLTMGRERFEVRVRLAGRETIDRRIDDVGAYFGLVRDLRMGFGPSEAWHVVVKDLAEDAAAKAEAEAAPAPAHLPASAPAAAPAAAPASAMAPASGAAPSVRPLP